MEFPIKLDCLGEEGDSVPPDGVRAPTFGKARVCPDATAGNLTLGLSFTRARVSRLMYRRATVYSSLASSMIAPTSLMMASSFGKMPMTSVRRLISRFIRSSGFVEAI